MDSFRVDSTGGKADLCVIEIFEISRQTRVHLRRTPARALRSKSERDVRAKLRRKTNQLFT